MMGSKLFIDYERRLPNFNNSYRLLEELPEGTHQFVHGITASDGAASVGVLHMPQGGAKVCAFYMHPRTNQTRPYLAPSLLKSGIAVWGQMSRYVNNDIDMTHEEVVLDLAAGMRTLRELGFETIIGIGNSGGSSLLAYFQSQASRPPGERQKLSPAGEPTGFETEDMPTFDMYVALALHLGEGAILQRMLDPSVVDERDPIAADPSLDMFNSANGYREFPSPSSYSADWLKHYRLAQIGRAKRLDRIAHSMLEDYHEARRHAVPSQLATTTARRALYARIMIVHRTSADPAFLDPAISPSRRPIGMVGDEHPVRVSYGFHGFARIITPRAWLSTWSGLSSHAELAETIPHVKVPTLIVFPDGDVGTFREDADNIFASCGAEDKTLYTLEWSTHYLTPTPCMPNDVEQPKPRAGKVVVDWIKARLN